MDKIAQGGVPLDQCLQTLKEVRDSNNEDTKYHQIENLRSQVSSPMISQKLGEILGALKIPDNIGTVDPSSGKPYPQTSSKLNELINQIEQMKETSKMSGNSFNFSKYAQQNQAPIKKKKTRGNPFRVLMGKIGKLLDHGLEKREITRYLMKEKIWNEETISRAVGVVKEYNKKKHKRVSESQTLPNAKNDWPRIDPDYSKRSNPELITSICWLNSLAHIDPNKTSFAKEVADRSGVKTMIRKIKSELLSRGMSEDDLNLIMK